jgi:hypothetical protein
VQTLPLADEPLVWTECDGYRVRWLPGAFGPYENIRDVLKYRILREEWNELEDGRYERTITDAVVLA